MRKERSGDPRHTRNVAIESFIEPFRINLFERFMTFPWKCCGIIHQHIEALAREESGRFCNRRLVADVQ